MAFALLANPRKNFYTTRKKPISQIILHVTAGLEDLDMNGIDHSAQKTNDYGASTIRAASWHKIVDSDSIEDALPDEYTAWHCRYYNSGTLGLEISNKDARWDNKPVNWTEATLLNAAKVCRDWEQKHQVPRRLLTKNEIDLGMKGYSYHSFLDPSRRHDPGLTFPWTRFVEILEGLDNGATSVKRPPALVKELQGLVHLDKDGLWGDHTDVSLRKMRTGAISNLGVIRTHEPFDVEFVQEHIGTTVDGIWGRQSQASLSWWIRLFQKTVKVAGTGIWDVDTEAAFQEARNKHYNKF